MTPTRVVLLGASNLMMGLPVMLGAVRAGLGPGPLEILVAAGHGRSYGRWSRLVLRGLPGIVECGLWPALAGSGGRTTYALVTDIGNDLAYGASADELVGWVATCVERLVAMEATVALTLLPAESLARLAPWRFHLLKTVTFPGRRLALAALRGRVAEVNARLAALAARHGVEVVTPAAGWYGADAIHIRPDRHGAAWLTMLSGWKAPGLAAADGRAVARLACRGLRPERWTLGGVPLGRVQPSGWLADGAPVSLF